MESTIDTGIKLSRTGTLKAIVLAAVAALALGTIAALPTKAFADSPRSPVATISIQHGGAR
jgi:hypothetical protein